MTAQAKSNKPQGVGSLPERSKRPYPFRTAVLLVLLAGNFLVAAIYFHIINP